MNSRVLWSIMSASVLGAVINNIVNRNGVEWLGSPRVFEKPELEEKIGFFEGLIAAIGESFQWIQSNWVLLSVITLAAILILVIFPRLNLGKPMPILLSMIRVLFGIMFLMACFPKVADPEGFATLVAQYQFLPEFMVNSFSLWLPMFELIIGFTIIFTPYEKENGYLYAVLFAMFIVALAQALARDLGITCGCFDIEGAQGKGEAWFSLLRDIVLLVPLAILLRYGGNRGLLQLKEHGRK